MTKPTKPLNLPWCNYPNAADTKQHGLLILPENLNTVDFVFVAKYRSNRYKAESIKTADYSKLLELASMLAASFTLNDPMNRHLQPARAIPSSIINYVHHDVLGDAPFGPWTGENIFFWFVRLLALTNTNDPISTIGINIDTLDLSLAIFNDRGKVIGGAINVPIYAEEKPLRENDPFLEALLSHIQPILGIILPQEHEALDALEEKFPKIKKAKELGKIGMHFLVARSPELPNEHTFELVAASAEHFQNLGYEYMAITATNQWTGSACEALGASRIHFAPYRTIKRVAVQGSELENEPYSKDGFISDKDSGMAYYILKL